MDKVTFKQQNARFRAPLHVLNEAVKDAPLGEGFTADTGLLYRTEARVLYSTLRNLFLHPNQPEPAGLAPDMALPSSRERLQAYTHLFLPAVSIISIGRAI